MPFLIALGAAVVLVPLARRAGIAAGLVDRPGDPLKIHARPVPVLGGVAVTAAAFAAMAVAGHPPPAAVVIAAALVLAGGVVDDTRPLPTAGHVALQLVAGGVLVVGAFDADALGAVGLLFAVLACTNAVNLIDGQDGLAGGLAAIAALGLAALAAGAPAWAPALGLALAGALGGFLLWNRPPARIFLGNGGAYAVGVALAALAAATVEAEGPRGVAPVAVCLAVFLFDLAFTVARRAGSGTLATGDRLHSYDLLSVRLGGRGRATLAFCGAGALAAAAALVIETMPLAPAVLTAAAIAALAGAGGRRLWSRRVTAHREEFVSTALGRRQPG